MNEKCTCPTVHFADNLSMPVVRDPACPLHGDAAVHRKFRLQQVRVDDTAEEISGLGEGDAEFERRARIAGRSY